jgi:ribosomal protein RSM22 (predicted rRNA methylase)
VIVDHGKREGFTVVAEAREYLLRLGRKEVKQALDLKSEDTRSLGCHIVAPVRVLSPDL